MSAAHPLSSTPPGMSAVLDRNISALLERRRHFEHTRSPRERIASAIGRFAGSHASLYVHAAFFGTWILVNVGLTPLPRFDPSLVILAMMASVEAIFLSTFVLMMQNRLAVMSEQRAELDLQISLLAEHEITRLLQLVAAIGQKLGIDQASDPELDALKKDVQPEQVLDRLDQVTRDSAGPGTSTPPTGS